MKTYSFATVVICLLAGFYTQTIHNRSNEVADEFESITEHSVKTENDDDDGVVEEKSEFEHHFPDDEEFEGFSKNDKASSFDSVRTETNNGIEPALEMVLVDWFSIFFTGKSSDTLSNALGLILAMAIRLLLL